MTKRFGVQLVGQPAQPVVQVEAPTPMLAVAEIAGCHWGAVCLPIWREGQRRDGTWERDCFMPRDDTGRQWVVHVPAHTS